MPTRTRNEMIVYAGELLRVHPECTEEHRLVVVELIARVLMRRVSGGTPHEPLSNMKEYVNRRIQLELDLGQTKDRLLEDDEFHQNYDIMDAIRAATVVFHGNRQRAIRNGKSQAESEGLERDYNMAASAFISWCFNQRLKESYIEGIVHAESILDTYNLH